MLEDLNTFSYLILTVLRLVAITSIFFFSDKRKMKLEWLSHTLIVMQLRTIGPEIQTQAVQLHSTRPDLHAIL